MLARLFFRSAAGAGRHGAGSQSSRVTCLQQRVEARALVGVRLISIKRRQVDRCKVRLMKSQASVPFVRQTGVSGMAVRRMQMTECPASRATCEAPRFLP